MGDAYTFGDTPLAARRLALLADVFAPTTASFLTRLGTGRRRLAVDLGCGPGFTTALLRDALAPERLLAVDASDAFVRDAARRLELTPSTAAAARMFAMNFAGWRAQPAVRMLAAPRELDEIAAGLDELTRTTGLRSEITWQLRQLSVGR